MVLWWESDTTKLAHNACHNEAQSCRFLPFDVNFALICGPVKFRIGFLWGCSTTMRMQEHNNKARKSVTTLMLLPEKMRVAWLKNEHWDLEKNKGQRKRRTIVESSWVFFHCLFGASFSWRIRSIVIIYTAHILSSYCAVSSRMRFSVCASRRALLWRRTWFSRSQQQKPPLWNWIFFFAIVMRAGN